VVVALIELSILQYAYERIGIKPRQALAILFLSFLGSSINIPVAELPPQSVESDQVVRFFGVAYVVPAVQRWPGTIIAVNVGGALIPTALSLYLLVRHQIYARALVATAVVAAVVYGLARPVRGIGITVPTLVPPVAACAAAMVLSWRRAAPLAYIAGSLGTLIGADLLNLGRMNGLGAPIASIGGAGTFDGVFMTGILAVLLAPAGRSMPPADPKGSAGPPTGPREENGIRRA
jgi:uncharacterized membrane protein